MIYLFEGEGKGKTSAALGVSLRGLLNGWRVLWVSFIKEESWQISEKGLREKFDNLEMDFVGRGFYVGNQESVISDLDDKRLKVKRIHGGVVVDKVGEEEHKRAAREGLELVRQKLLLGDYQLVVMDEINNAVSEGLVEEGEVVKVLKQRGETHVVLTGRLKPESKLREMADLVTECRKIRHPYDRGVIAVKGLDY